MGRVGPHDNHWAVGSVKDIAADRPEEQPAEAATSPATDDDELGAFGCVDEDVSGSTLHHMWAHVHLRVLRRSLGDRLGGDGLPIELEVVPGVLKNAHRDAARVLVGVP